MVSIKDYYELLATTHPARFRFSATTNQSVTIPGPFGNIEVVGQVGLPDGVIYQRATSEIIVQHSISLVDSSVESPGDQNSRELTLTTYRVVPDLTTKMTITGLDLTL